MTKKRVVTGFVQSVRPGRRALRIQGPPSITEALEREGWIRLSAAAGPEHRFKILSAHPTADGCVVELVPGVPRDTVARLRGSRVIAALVEPEGPALNDVNLAEVMGMAVYDEDGAEIGEVAALYEGKAHDMAEIRRPEGATVIVPLIPPAVTAVDTEARRLILGDWTPYSVTYED